MSEHKHRSSTPGGGEVVIPNKGTPNSDFETSLVELQNIVTKFVGNEICKFAVRLGMISPYAYATNHCVVARATQEVVMTLHVRFSNASPERYKELMQEIERH